jgi:hypothetical protein
MNTFTRIVNGQTYTVTRVDSTLVTLWVNGEAADETTHLDATAAAEAFIAICTTLRVVAGERFV